MGSRMNFIKWDLFSVQYPVSATTVSSSHFCKGKDGFCLMMRLSSSSSVLYGDAEGVNDSYRAHSYSSSSSSSASHLVENYYLETRDVKVSSHFESSGDDLGDNRVELMSNEDGFHCFPSLNATKTPQFRLLMKNLDVLESMFTDSNALSLERDILDKLERLGAIHFFNSCLEETLRRYASSSCTTASAVDVLEELQSNGSGNNVVEKVIIRSGRKEQRKLRRKGRVQDEECRDSETELASASLRSRSKRQTVAKSEADLATGVKLVAELQRIRMVLEEESGQAANFRSWAEAAGIDTEELQRRLHNGLRCRVELLRTSRSLVVYIARDYKGLGIAFEDLIQAGKMAVLRGAERFDKSRGYKFSTYVQYWIRKYMSMLVARHARGVRIPGALSKAINQVQNARKALCSSNGKHPSDTEIAHFTGLSIERIRTASRCLKVVGSIDQKIGDCISIKFMEIISDETIPSPEETVIRDQMAKEIHTLLRKLEAIEQKVLVLRFGIGSKNHETKSLDETGKLLRVSKEWIRKIERRALTKLRTKSSLSTLSHYMHIQ